MPLQSLRARTGNAAMRSHHRLDRGCARRRAMTPAYPPAPGQAPVADYDYKIGPLDNLNIIVWRNPELSMSVPVRPDGKVTTPLIDELVAHGKTSVELPARSRSSSQSTSASRSSPSS